MRMRQSRDPLPANLAVASVETVRRLGPAYTGLVGDRVLGCAGITRCWPGVGEAWTVFSEEVCHHPLWLQKTVRSVIHASMVGMGLHRLQAVARAESARNCKWLESLGFQWEGPMPKFGPDGADYVRYGMVRRG